jgi:hypothetical protein
MGSRHLFPVLLLAAACSGSGPGGSSGTAPAAPASGPAGAPRPPFVLRVDGPSFPETGVAGLAVTLERSSPSKVPVELRLGVPGGLRVVEGVAEETIEEEGPVISRHFRVAVEDPSAALEVTASLRGDAMGAFARREIRFDGRREPNRPPARPGGTIVPGD